MPNTCRAGEAAIGTASFGTQWAMILAAGKRSVTNDGEAYIGGRSNTGHPDFSFPCEFNRLNRFEPWRENPRVGSSILFSHEKNAKITALSPVQEKGNRSRVSNEARNPESIGKGLSYSAGSGLLRGHFRIALACPRSTGISSGTVLRKVDLPPFGRSAVYRGQYRVACCAQR